MSKTHTKGPWDWAIDDKYIYIGAGARVSYMNWLAKVDYDDVDHDIAEGDARLITAAPDLLDAGERALDALEKLEAGDTKVAKQLRIAVTKARGFD